MPTSVHSMGDLEDADNAFRESVGLGTRRDREDFITVHDPDGFTMNIPRDEYYAMYPDQNQSTTGKANDNGSSMKLTQENLNTLPRSYSLPSFGSVHPFDLAPQVTDMLSDDQCVPDMDKDVDELSLPDLASDSGSMLETPLQDTEDPMNQMNLNMEVSEAVGPPKTLSVPTISLTAPDPRDETSEAECKSETSESETVDWHEERGLTEFRVTEGPPPWVMEDFETGGGHGMTVSPDGTTIVKKTHLQEIIFYERIQSNDQPLRAIRLWVPEYRGCFTDNPLVSKGKGSQSFSPFSVNSKLSMALPISSSGSNKGSRPPLRPGLIRNNTADTHSDSIMLENLKCGFIPSTISEFDIKLGRNMVDPWATDTNRAKIDVMARQVRDSTSFLDAVRLIWAMTSIQDPVTGLSRHVKTDKQYGKSLKRSTDDHERANCETLSDAMVRLFPSPRDLIVPKGHSDWTKSESEQSEGPLRFKSDLHRYRFDEWLNPWKNPRRSVLSFLPLSTSTGQSRHGPRADLFDLQRMNRERDQVDETIETIRHVRQQIRSLRKAVSETPWRFAGSSLYVVHGEADTKFALGPTDKEEEVNESQIESYLKFIGYYDYDPATYKYRINDEEDMDVRLDDLPDSLRFNYFSPFHHPTRESVVKLIDFARTDIAEEPDKDVMDGLQTIINLMGSRISTLKDMKEDMQDQIVRTRDQIMSPR